MGNDVIVIVGSGGMGVAIAHRLGSGRTLVLADLNSDNLDAATRVFGVAGNPISHSLSPLMHNTAFRREHVR